MIWCRKFTEHSSDYIDKKGPWYARLAMWMHVLMCVKCRRYLRQMRAVVRGCAALGRAEERDRAPIEPQALDRLTEALREAP